MNGFSIYYRNPTCPCQRCRLHGLWGPAMLVTVGVLFLLDNMRILRFDHSWPVILIVVGIVKFAQSGATTQGHIPPYWAHPAAVPPGSASASNNPQNDIRNAPDSDTDR